MFTSRKDAATHLARALAPWAAEHPVVLGLPRGGVPLATYVAEQLGAPVDVLIVRKLGAPWNPEFGYGAISEGGVEVRDPETIRGLGLDAATMAQVKAQELAEVERRVLMYRGDRPAENLSGRTVIIVDDGIATGVTMRAAVEVVRARVPHRIIVAAPVGSTQARDMLEQVADEVVLVEVPRDFRAVGLHYGDFSQVTDAEVTAALSQAHGAAGGEGSHRVGVATSGTSSASGADGEGGGAVDEEVSIPCDGVHLPGTLQVPANAHGVVVFAHGSGSGRHSPRNREVATRLQSDGLGTLLFDLLTDVEAMDRRNVFDITLLANRVLAAAHWVVRHPACARPTVPLARPGGSGGGPTSGPTSGSATAGGVALRPARAAGSDAAGEHLPVGLFGASTGGGAALVAAASDPELVQAVVSRGGRPDLAGRALGAVRAPTLLIVGSLDDQVLALNRHAAAQMVCEVQVDIVPGAGHVFSEPGTLDQVAEMAAGWFNAWLR